MAEPRSVAGRGNGPPQQAEVKPLASPCHHRTWHMALPDAASERGVRRHGPMWRRWAWRQYVIRRQGLGASRHVFTVVGRYVGVRRIPQANSMAVEVAIRAIEIRVVLVIPVVGDYSLVRVLLAVFVRCTFHK